MTINKQWLLASRPKGEATVDNFRLVETPVPALTDFKQMLAQSK